MTVDFTNPNLFAIYFLKMTLRDGTILRYSNINAYAKEIDGSNNFYEGRLNEVDSLVFGFNDLRDSFSIVSSLNFAILTGKQRDTDTDLNTTFANYFFPDAQVELFLASKETFLSSAGLSMGPGLTMGPGLFMGARSMSTNQYSSEQFVLNATDLIFEGKLAYPDAYTLWTEEEMRFQCVDELSNDQIQNSINRLEKGSANFRNAFEGVRDANIGKYIPIVYGNWLGDFGIPGYVVEGFPLRNDWDLKLGESVDLLAGSAPFKSISTKFLIEGIKERTANSVDASAGTVNIDAFKIANALETASFAAEGKTVSSDYVATSSASANDLIQDVVAICYDLLRNNLQIVGGDINFASWNVPTTFTDHTARAVLLGEESLVDTLRRLAFEFGFFLYKINGRWILEQAPNSSSASADYTVNAKDIAPGSYSISLDPNRVYFNSFEFQYAYDAITQSYQQTISSVIESKKVEHGQQRDIFLESKFQYRKVEVLETIGRLLQLFANPVESVNVSCYSSIFEIKPNDVVDFTFHKYVNQKMLVRQVTKNLQNFEVSLVMFPLPERKTKLYKSAPSNLTDYSSPAADTGYFHASLEIVKNHNDKIVVDSITVTIAPGYYDTAAALCTEIQTKVNAQSVSNPFAISYNTATRKFTITTDDDISWTTQPDLGRDTLAFDVSADDTGASSYTSDYVAVFDTSDSERLTEYA